MLRKGNKLPASLKPHQFRFFLPSPSLIVWRLFWVSLPPVFCGHLSDGKSVEYRAEGLLASFGASILLGTGFLISSMQALQAFQSGSAEAQALMNRLSVFFKFRNGLPRAA